jgi:cyclophilin family peptidyl-prolyl cis-trans isomerase
MSKKKGTHARSARGGKGEGSGGGGGESDPLKVNWFVLGGTLLVVAVIVFFAIRPSLTAPGATPTAAAGSGTGSGDCTPSNLQWPEAPAMTVDPAKDYKATFKLQKGSEFVVQLFPDKAPITVNSFVFLARQGYYDCVTFHRVLQDPPMAQGGDPTGTGMGGPGYQFVNEQSDLLFDRPGRIAMANAGPDTNGSQFFITFDAVDYLNGGYTIFGEVIEGMEVVNAITPRDPNLAPDFQGDVIETITISES